MSQFSTLFHRLVKKHEAGRALSDADVMASLRRSIDVVVHCVRDGPRRFIEQVLYEPELKTPLPTNHSVTAE